jgi:hypothetical protein
LRAITIVSPGPATLMIATCTLSDEPFVEKSVSLAPVASAKSPGASSIVACMTVPTSAPRIRSRSG